MRRFPDMRGAALGFGIAAFIAAAGFWQYAELTALEDSGGSIRVHSLVRLIYGVGGKFSVLAVFLLLAGAIFNLGLERYRGEGS